MGVGASEGRAPCLLELGSEAPSPPPGSAMLRALGRLAGRPRQATSLCYLESGRAHGSHDGPCFAGSHSKVTEPGVPGLPGLTPGLQRPTEDHTTPHLPPELLCFPGPFTPRVPSPQRAPPRCSSLLPSGVWGLGSGWAHMNA